mmetsp:Transcript_21815/g.65949  ORF Transcript_21815/g.65949 Transcript_21815/m.65949 type:complete len:229 (+) Transcript_21815:117-803(+)
MSASSSCPASARRSLSPSLGPWGKARPWSTSTASLRVERPRSGHGRGSSKKYLAGSRRSKASLRPSPISGVTLCAQARGSSSSATAAGELFAALESTWRTGAVASASTSTPPPASSQSTKVAIFESQRSCSRASMARNATSFESGSRRQRSSRLRMASRLSVLTRMRRAAGNRRMTDSSSLLTAGTARPHSNSRQTRRVPSPPSAELSVRSHSLYAAICALRRRLEKA